MKQDDAEVLDLVYKLESLVENSKDFMEIIIGLDRYEFFELTGKIRSTLSDESRRANIVAINE